MRPLTVSVVTCFALLLGSAVLPSTADACSAAFCASGVQVAPRGNVPANVGEVTVWSGGLGAFPRSLDFSLRVWDASDPGRILFSGASGTRGPAYLSFGPLFEAGREYVLEVTPQCFGPGERPPTLVTFRAEAESAPPADLGPLTVVRSGPTQVPIGGGAGCYEGFDASAVELTLDPSHVAPPWRDLLTSYELMVDGSPFAWTMTSGAIGPTAAPRGAYFAAPAGAFQAWTPCRAASSSDAGVIVVQPPGSTTGLSPGKHTVWVRARVPTAEPRVIESERIEVELRCPNQAPAPDDEPTEPTDPEEPTTPGDESSAPGDDPAKTQDGPRPSAAESGCALAANAVGADGLATAMLAIVLTLSVRRRASSTRNRKRA